MRQLVNECISKASIVLSGLDHAYIIEISALKRWAIFHESSLLRRTGHKNIPFAQPTARSAKARESLVETVMILSQRCERE